jgi:hypothetical protein
MTIAAYRISVEDQAAVADSTSRADGVPSKEVTLRSIGAGTTHEFSFSGVYPGPAPTLTQGEDPRDWTFTPSAAYGQSFDIDLVVDRLTGDPKRASLTYRIPSEVKGLLFPVGSDPSTVAAQVALAAVEADVSVDEAAADVSELQDAVAALEETADALVLTAPVARVTMPADSTLTGAQADTETEHAALALTGLVARGTIRWLARVVCTGQNAADTWRPRVYLDEELIADLGTIAFTPGQESTIEGEIQIRTLGASGTFDSSTEGDNPVTGEDERDSVVDGAVDTTGPSVPLSVTNECSTNNADNIITLRDFSAEVWPA